MSVRESLQGVYEGVHAHALMLHLRSWEGGCLLLYTRGDCRGLGLACGDRRWTRPYFTGSLNGKLPCNLSFALR